MYRFWVQSQTERTGHKPQLTLSNDNVLECTRPASTWNLTMMLCSGHFASHTLSACCGRTVLRTHVKSTPSRQIHEGRMRQHGKCSSCGMKCRKDQSKVAADRGSLHASVRFLSICFVHSFLRSLFTIRAYETACLYDCCDCMDAFICACLVLCLFCMLVVTGGVWQEAGRTIVLARFLPATMLKAMSSWYGMLCPMLREHMHKGPRVAPSASS